jgi:hypothetical protein
MGGSDLGVVRRSVRCALGVGLIGRGHVLG